MIHGFHGATQGGFTGISKARAVNVLFCTSACSATNNRTAPGTATRLPRDLDKRQTRNTSCKPPSSARALGTGFSHEGMGHRETVAATPTMAVPVHSTVLSFVPEINACSGHGDGSMGDMRWTWLSACRLYWPLFPQKTLVTVTRQYLTHQIIHRPAASGWNDRLVPANCSPAASPAEIDRAFIHACGMQYRGRGGGVVPSQIRGGKFRCGNFAEAPGFCVANFTDTPRNAVVYRALQARWSSARCQFLGRPWVWCGKFHRQFETRNFPPELNCPPNPPSCTAWEIPSLLLLLLLLLFRVWQGSFSADRFHDI